MYTSYKKLLEKQHNALHKAAYIRRSLLSHIIKQHGIVGIITYYM